MSTRSELLDRASVLTEILNVHRDILSSDHFQFIAEVAQAWIDVAASMPSVAPDCGGVSTHTESVNG